MLKPRYIIIIILAMFMLLSITGFAMELVLMNHSANTAITMVEIAAESAMKAAVMSDEFFTSTATPNTAVKTGIAAMRFKDLGTDVYTVEDIGGFNYATSASGNFTRNNSVYHILYNVSGNDADEKIYEKIFAESETFKNWVNAILPYELEDPTRKVFYSDTQIFPDGTKGVKTYFRSGYILVPRLFSMGADMIFDLYDDTASNSKGGIRHTYAGNPDVRYVTTAPDRDPSTNGSCYGDTAWNALKYTNIEGKSLALKELTEAGKSLVMWNNNNALNPIPQILEDSDMWDSKRTTTAYGNDVDYYITPTALGLTYFDPDLLDILFRTNMDLLMRAKYMVPSADGYTMSAEYNPVIDTGFYDIGEGGFNWANAICNNGDMYYVRGEYNSANRDFRIAGTTLKEPDIEYIYIYPDALQGKGNTAFKREKLITELSELGYDSDNTLHDKIMNQYVIPATEEYATAEWRTILSRAIDANYKLENFVNPLASESYEIVIAKVTFYADFIVPYKTSAVRGMARSFGDYDGSGLDTWANTEAGFRALQLNEDIINSLSDLYLEGNDTNSAVLSSKVHEGFLEDSVQLAYTTYYAITP